MKKFLLIICLMLCSCTAVNEMVNVKEEAKEMNFQTAFVRKDYKPVGRVRKEYSRTCFLFNLFCSKPYFVQDDLISEAKTMGANEVINITLDISKTPLIWSWLYSYEEIKANGLAVLLTPEDLSRSKNK
ncbi:MAG: hypothetical protein J6Y03_04925 [Alphaproteobacteria bacterium]|nr:hypothetical protein [Alphaproteobacteria bacterium]